MKRAKICHFYVEVDKINTFEIILGKGKKIFWGQISLPLVGPPRELHPLDLFVITID